MEGRIQVNATLLNSTLGSVAVSLCAAATSPAGPCGFSHKDPQGDGELTVISRVNGRELRGSHIFKRPTRDGQISIGAAPIASFTFAENQFDTPRERKLVPEEEQFWPPGGITDANSF